MSETELPTVLVLTPVKDAAAEAPGYVDRLLALDYPPERLSLGILVSDSVDQSTEAFRRETARLTSWRRTTLLQRDFGYRIPDGVARWEPSIQLERRSVLAKSRNHLLFGALADEEWVLWLDADVIEFAPDILRLLLMMRRDIVQPHCVRDWGGPTFDLNAWIDHGRRHLDDLRGASILVELHAVGGTMLLVRADLHRDGLVFPPFRYGLANPRVRRDPAAVGRDELGELETEGLAIMANDMGVACWGLPDVEIRHR
jgi:peptide chain release factor subunit 1